MAAYASSSGCDEFDGFDENDELLAREKLRSDLINIERSCEEVRNEEYHESDISNFESESDESGDETDEIDDPFLRNLNAGWSGELTDIHLQRFTEKKGVKHNLNSDAKPVEYFFLSFCQMNSLKLCRTKLTGTLLKKVLHVGIGSRKLQRKCAHLSP